MRITKRKGRATDAIARRFKPLAERLETRRLLSVSSLTDGSTSLGYLPASGVSTAAMVDWSPSALFVSPEAMTTSPSGDNRIESLRSGYKWGTSSLTYSFYAGGNYYSSQVSNPSPVSEALKANVRHILTNIFSPVINMTFVEVPDTPTSYGVMRFTGTPSASYAAAYYPTAGDTNTGSAIDIVGDVIFNPANDVEGSDLNSRNSSFQSGPGSHGFLSIIHEIGHALGLKHSFQGGSAPGSSVTLPVAEENQDNTVMTYTFDGQSPATLMPYDVLTLQYYYGANTTTRSTDTTYSFTAVDNFSPGSGSTNAPKTPFDRMKQTLWDAGGSDTLDLSALPSETGGYRIDVQPGGWITRNASYNSVTYSGSNKTTDFGTRIALSGTVIENVIVTGSGDSIFMNSAANRISGYTPGVATGADVINSSNQADTLDLTKFLESEVAKSQAGNDLVLNLGGSTGTITVKDYYASPADRITILYKSGSGGGATLSIAAAAAEKPEGNSGPTAFTFTVTRSGNLTGSSSASWAVTGSGASAADAVDFTGGTFPTGSVSFAANQSTATITVNVAGDTVAEQNEGFAVTLSAPTGATLGTPATASGTIYDDDSSPPPPPAPSLSISDLTLVEGNSGNTSGYVTIKLSQAPTQNVTVKWAPKAGTATAGTDYSFPTSGGTVTFSPGGSTERQIDVVVTGDTAVEPDETFSIVLSDAQGATIADGEGVITISNDDVGPPSLAIGDSVLTEGNSGTSEAVFTVKLTSPAIAVTTVAYKTKDASATVAGGDYLATSGTLTFQPGESVKEIRVPVKGDTAFEPNETFLVLLSNPTGGAAIGDDSAIGTILNDDAEPPPLTLTARGARVVEGTGAASTIARIPVTLSRPTDKTIAVRYSVQSGSATAGSDFSSASGIIYVAAGRTSVEIPIAIVADSVVEADETFTVNLVSMDARVLTPQVSVTIINDDKLSAPPTPRISNTSVIEGNAGNASLVFRITLAQPATETITLGFRTVDGTAVKGRDYVARTGTITFLRGRSEVVVVVSVISNRLVDGDRSLKLEVFDSKSPQTALAWATGTIRDDDRFTTSRATVPPGTLAAAFAAYSR